MLCYSLIGSVCCFKKERFQCVKCYLEPNTAIKCSGVSASCGIAAAAAGSAAADMLLLSHESLLLLLLLLLLLGPGCHSCADSAAAAHSVQPAAGCRLGETVNFMVKLL
jgi:hypothetical protein